MLSSFLSIRNYALCISVDNVWLRKAMASCDSWRKEILLTFRQGSIFRYIQAWLVNL